MRKPNLVSSLIILNLILIASLIFLSTSQWVKAQPTELQTTPPIISYQGFLTDDIGQPVDGTKNLVFRIYASDSDPSPLWQETHAGVPVSAGDFAVLLGEFTPFGDDLFDSPDRWLEIEVEGVTLSPRQPFTSVPYALNADKLDGLDSQEIMAGQLPPGAIVWFPEKRAPEGYSPHPTALGEDVGPWESIAVMPADLIGSYFCKIWTGEDVLCWGSYAGQPGGVRYNYSENAWYPISPVGGPEAYYGFSSIWTGSEMIVWGGQSYSNVLVNSGATYNPVTDTWTRMTDLNSPSPRWYHGAVWTGSEMIIWGGRGDIGDLGDGYRYSPANDTWTEISIDGAPSPRIPGNVLWTGSEMIVWAGTVNSLVPIMDGALYNPFTESWRPLNIEGGVSSSLHGIQQPYAVWTGKEMAVSSNNHLLFFNPVTNTWRDQVCFQLKFETNNEFQEMPLAKAGNYLITFGSLYDLTLDKVVTKFSAMNWSNIFWTGQELLLLEVPNNIGNIIGMHHTIDLIFPYQKD